MKFILIIKNNTSKYVINSSTSIPIKVRKIDLAVQISLRVFQGVEKFSFIGVKGRERSSVDIHTSSRPRPLSRSHALSEYVNRDRDINDCIQQMGRILRITEEERDAIFIGEKVDTIRDKCADRKIVAKLMFGRSISRRV
ncbi:hypothetical protein Droror1_Dr00027777 [Drosera rotundifolia]